MRALVASILAFFTPAQASSEVGRIGIASWHDFGERRVCASNFHPKGKWLRVEYQDRWVVVRVVSTGPNERLGRIIDLSPDAFEHLAPLALGLITVRVIPLQ